MERKFNHTHNSLLITHYSRIAVITHFYSPGPAHELVDYLVPKVKELIFFGQPLPAKADEPSFLRIYQNGRLTQEKFGHIFRLPDMIRYLKDFFCVFWFLLFNRKFDLIISLDPLNTAAIIRPLANYKSLVYYTIDYIPNRFRQKWLNSFYHWLDRQAVKKSDWIWNLSPRMVEGRRKRWGTNKFDDKQLVVPMGTHALRAKNQELRIKNQVIFMGHLREGQGVETLLEAVAIAIKKIPDLKLIIVGGGELLDSLKQLTQKLKIERPVTFTGFVKDNQTMRNYLLNSTIAVAPYKNTPDNFTYWSDPGKPKEYLAAGLPVLISDVPAIAKEIEIAGAGLIIKDDPKSLAAAMIKLLADSKKLETYRSNSLKLAATFRWENIYDNAFDKMESPSLEKRGEGRF